MAKRKAARRKAATTRRKAGRTRSAAKKTASAARKAARKKVARKAPRAVARKAVRKGAARKVAKSPRKVAARKASAPKASAAPKTAAAPRTSPAPKTVSLKTRVVKPPVRTAPGLNRERRIVRDEDIVPTPPSSLDFDRSASAARSGRRELRERYDEHTETSPALTGGDVDADWESAYSVGDEAPGGDNPTPDQDLVDDIGRAVGVEYQDNEELKGEAKISKRDRNRWELDPASSDDWDER
jgi:hypothetical protein